MRRVTCFLWLGAFLWPCMAHAQDIHKGPIFGETPRKILRKIPGFGDRLCLIYKQWTLVHGNVGSKRWIMIKRGGTKKNCTQGQAYMYIPGGSRSVPMAIRGFWYPYVFVQSQHNPISYDFHIFSLKNKTLLWNSPSIPVGLDVKWDPKRRSLTYMSSLPIKKVCRGYPWTSTEFNAQLEKCWPTIIRKHRSIRRTKRPKCAIGSLIPGLIVARALYLGRRLKIRMGRAVRCMYYP